MPRTPLLAAALALAAAGPGQATRLPDVFTDLYIFGDSLSDSADSLRAPGTAVTEALSNTGRVTNAILGTPFPPPPYFNGRFSDGPVWSDSLIAEFEAAGRTGRNFAFGGARAVRSVDAPVDIPDFADQRTAFRFDPTIAPGTRPLAVVVFGGNDLFAITDASGGDVPAAQAAARAAADEVAAQIALFDTLTVRDFALVNVGDIGATPRYAVPTLHDGMPNPRHPLQPVASAATAAFNARLDAVADTLRTGGRRIYEVDAAGALAGVLADPLAGGFRDATTPCGVPVGSDPLTGLPAVDFGQPDGPGNESGISPTGCITVPFAGLAGSPANVTEFAWFDDVHPTSPIQAELARTIRGTVAAAIPLPAPALLLAGALAALSGARRVAWPTRTVTRAVQHLRLRRPVRCGRRTTGPGLQAGAAPIPVEERAKVPGEGRFHARGVVLSPRPGHAAIAPAVMAEEANKPGSATISGRLS